MDPFRNNQFTTNHHRTSYDETTLRELAEQNLIYLVGLGFSELHDLYPDVDCTLRLGLPGYEAPKPVFPEPVLVLIPMNQRMFEPANIVTSPMHMYFGPPQIPGSCGNTYARYNGAMGDQSPFFQCPGMIDLNVRPNSFGFYDMGPSMVIPVMGSSSTFCFNHAFHPSFYYKGENSAPMNNMFQQASVEPSAPPEAELVRRCMVCETSCTPLWRNGPLGAKSLCNACGIRYKKEEKKMMERMDYPTGKDK